MSEAQRRKVIDLHMNFYALTLDLRDTMNTNTRVARLCDVTSDCLSLLDELTGDYRMEPV